MNYIKVPYLPDQDDPTKLEVVYYPKFLPINTQSKLVWKEEHDPTRMAKVLIGRNRRHYSQADGTPFTIGTPLYIWTVCLHGTL